MIRTKNFKVFVVLTSSMAAVLLASLLAPSLFEKPARAAADDNLQFEIKVVNILSTGSFLVGLDKVNPNQERD